MRTFLPVVLVAIVLAVAPITGPDIPARVLEYVQPPIPAEVSLIAVGDIMLSRTVAKRMRQYGPDYPFASTTSLIAEADIAFGNLETPITPGPEILAYEMSFRADIEAAAALRRAGFDILSLANNHTPNFGPGGLEDTLWLLNEEGVMHAGAGKNDVEAGQPMFMSVQGITFAFLAYTDPWIMPASYEAGEGRAGVAFMDIQTMTTAVEAAQILADIVIVSMHAGDEYEPQPNERQKAFARAAIDAGAEMVIGHHPHVVQTSEVYKGKHIFYSLGNFVFDQMWSRATREGLVVKAVFRKDGLLRLEYHPVLIEDYAQPRFLEEVEAIQKVLDRLTAAP